MYHPLLLQPEVLRELPALLDDLAPRRAEPAVLSYRSEAFAEDLCEPAAPVDAPVRRGRALLLSVAPLGAALVGGAVLLLG